MPFERALIGKPSRFSCRLSCCFGVRCAGSWYAWCPRADWRVLGGVLCSGPAGTGRTGFGVSALSAWGAVTGWSAGWCVSQVSTIAVVWSQDPEVGAFFDAVVAEDDQFVEDRARERVQPYLVFAAVDEAAQAAAQMSDVLLD